MKWVNIAVLLILALAAMRVGSWALGWVLTKFAALSARSRAIASNAAALAGFVVLLTVNLMPGERLELGELLFGFVVFAVYCVSDFFWTPWRPRKI